MPKPHIVEPPSLQDRGDLDVRITFAEPIDRRLFRDWFETLGLPSYITYCHRHYDETRQKETQDG